MTTIKLKLHDKEFSKISKLAQRRSCSVAAVITDLIAGMEIPGASEDSITALFSDEPEMMDDIIEVIMKSRESHPLRVMVNVEKPLRLSGFA